MQLPKVWKWLLIEQAYGPYDQYFDNYEWFYQTFELVALAPDFFLPDW